MNKEPAPSAQRDTVVDWIDYHGRFNGQRVATIDVDTGRQHNYAELNERATRLAAGLRDNFGIGYQDRVAMLAHNSSDIFETLFACWKLGAIFVPLNWRLNTAEIERLLIHCAPGVLLLDQELNIELNTQCPLLSRAAQPADSAYEALIAASPADAFMPRLSQDDRNLILYTSGTTGPPKGVIYTFQMTMNIVINASVHARIDRDTRTLTYLPLFHTAGLNGCALPVFHYGGTICIMQRWDPSATFDYLTSADNGITHSIGVPTNYIMLAELPGFAEARFSSLRYLGIGSSPVPIGLLEKWEAKGVDLVQSYGMTEAFCVSLTPPEQAREKLGSAGHALLHVEIRIANEEGQCVPAGSIGEVQLRGSGVTPGYWREPELTAAAFIDDWFRTGDAARMEPDGTLYIVDRFKDMLISGGENVYPSEIEDVISRFDEVLQVAVIGVPDPKWQEIGLALIVVRDGYNLSPDEVRNRCREHLAAYKVPKKIQFVEGLPLSPQGKVLKRELRHKYSTGNENV